MESRPRTWPEEFTADEIARIDRIAAKAILACGIIFITLIAPRIFT
jgi:hypothetical protein